MSLSTRIVASMTKENRSPVATEAWHPRTDPGSAFTAFWVGFPVVLGLFSGWNQIGMVAPALPLAWSIIYWLVLAVIMWLGLGLGTLIASAALKRLPYPFLLIWGAVIGVALTRPVHVQYQQMFVPLALPGRSASTLPAFPFTATDWLQLYQGNLLLMLFWIFGALFFRDFIGYSPLGKSRATLVEPVQNRLAFDQVTLRFAIRLKKLSFESIDTIMAEDHYVHCFGEQGEELLLYRFADVVEELSHHGWIRVHRSACVRQDRVMRVANGARRMSLTMRSGRIVPISARYEALAQASIVASRRV